MVAAPDNTGYAAATFPPTPDIPAGLDEIARSAIRLEAPAPIRSSDVAAGGEGGEGGEGVGSTYTVVLKKGAQGLGLNLGVRGFRVCVVAFRRAANDPHAAPGPAEASGQIELGDVLLSIDGAPVRPCSEGETEGMEDVFRLLQQSGASVAFRFQRGGVGGAAVAAAAVGLAASAGTGVGGGASPFGRPRDGSGGFGTPLPATPPGHVAAASSSSSSPFGPGSPMRISGASALAALRSSGLISGVSEDNAGRDDAAAGGGDSNAGAGAGGGNASPGGAGGGGYYGGAGGHGEQTAMNALLQSQLAEARAHSLEQDRIIRALRLQKGTGGSGPGEAGNGVGLLARVAAEPPPAALPEEIAAERRAHAAWRGRWRGEVRNVFGLAAARGEDNGKLRWQLAEAKRQLAGARARAVAAERCGIAVVARDMWRRGRRRERRVRLRKQGGGGRGGRGGGGAAAASDFSKAVESLPPELASLMSAGNGGGGEGLGSGLGFSTDDDEEDGEERERGAAAASAAAAGTEELRRAAEIVAQAAAARVARGAAASEMSVVGALRAGVRAEASAETARLTRLRALLQEAEAGRRRARAVAVSCLQGSEGSGVDAACVATVEEAEAWARAGADGIDGPLPMAGTGFNRFEDMGAAPATEAVGEEQQESAGAAAAAAAVEGGAEDGEEDKAASAAIEVDEDSDDWFKRNGIDKSAELIQLKELGTNKLAEAHLSMRAELLRLRVECEQLRGVLAVAGGSNGSANDEMSGQSTAGGGGDGGSGASGKSANTSEWHEIFDLEEPSPHAFGSQVIQHVIESWFEEQRKSDFFQAQRKREFVTGWLRHLVENEGVRNCFGLAALLPPAPSSSSTQRPWLTHACLPDALRFPLHRPPASMAFPPPSPLAACPAR